MIANAASGIVPAAQQQQTVATEAEVIGSMTPFSRGALKCQEEGTPQTVTLGNSAVPVPITLPMINGYDRKVLLRIELLSSGNSATVAVSNIDSPYSAVNLITKQDNRQQLLYQLGGWRANFADEFGGYGVFKRASDTNSNTAITTGSGATAGSGQFYIAIPDEFARDGWGCWPNMDSSQRRTITVTMAPLSNIYSTPPNGTVQAKITPIIHYYAAPPSVDAMGIAIEQRPPMLGSVSYWREQIEPVLQGDNTLTVRLAGRWIRNLFAVFLTNSDVRSDSVMPARIRAELDNNKLFDVTRASMLNELYTKMGLVAPVGVFPINVGTLAPDGLQGNDWPDGWLPSSSGSQLVLKFNSGTAGKVALMFNEVVLAGPIPSNI
jgi:hypothetical protein